jgi:hypothetical protein
VTRVFIVLLGIGVLSAACSDAQLAPPPDAMAEAEDAVELFEDIPPAAPAAPAPPPAPARPRAQAQAAAPAPSPRVEPAAPVRVVPEYREVVVPAGTMLALRLASAVASDTSQVEDLVRATLRSDLVMDGEVVPAGTELMGHVVDVERSGRVRGRARVAFRFGAMRHGGEEYDVRTEIIERVAEATKGEDATKIGVGAGAGAALGALLGGGSGAAKGAAIGAAAGTGAVLATRGDEVRLEPGEPIETKLTAPLAVRFRVR